jgi:chemotaxis protein methyltransferase CheR
VWRRIGHRIADLHLAGPDAYREYLESHAAEWRTLDGFCSVSISRFFRDREVFKRLATDVLPQLAGQVARHSRGRLAAWSAGCASGEEAYSLVLLWRSRLARQFPSVTFDVLGTDIDQGLLQRARVARYRRSSLREVPRAIVDAAFTRDGEWFELREEFRSRVEFRRGDLRADLPDRSFDLVLCRNVVCTYFEPSQRRTPPALTVLRPGGAFVIGSGERLPDELPASRRGSRTASTDAMSLAAVRRADGTRSWS